MTRPSAGGASTSKSASTRARARGGPSRPPHASGRRDEAFFLFRKCYELQGILTPLPAHERGLGAGDRPHRSDLERLDDARELGARAHRDAHGSQVFGLEQREGLDVADVLPSQYRYEALEIKGGQGAFERRTSKR